MVNGFTFLNSQHNQLTRSVNDLSKCIWKGEILWKLSTDGMILQMLIVDTDK